MASRAAAARSATWCPHRYRLAAYTLTVDGVVIDPHWNGGAVAYTQLRSGANNYQALSQPYVSSPLYSSLSSGPPFVVLSPLPGQSIAQGCTLRVEFTRDIPRLEIRILADGADGSHPVLLEDVLTGTSQEPSPSLEAEDFLYLSSPNGSTGCIELYDPQGPDRPGHSMSFPIWFEPEQTLEIAVYFPNRSVRSPSGGDEAVFPVRRTVSLDSDVARGALEQLFRGPTGPEEEKGYFPCLTPECREQDHDYVEHPCSLKVTDLSLEDGIADAWFHDVHWCKIIRGERGIVGFETALAQIRETLLHLPGVRRVVIW